MRTRLYILLACIPLMAISQTRKDTALSFFPHAVGDYWEVAHVALHMNPGTISTKRITVSDRRSMPNGQVYSVFRIAHGTTASLDTAYYRVDSTLAFVWQYLPSSNSEVLIDSLLGSHYVWRSGIVFGVPTTIRYRSVPYSYSAYASGIGLYYTSWDESGFPHADTLLYAYVAGNMYAFLSHTDKEPGVPSEFSVSNAYPNPFNPGTSVTVSLDRAAHVQATVLDQLGRLVHTLLDRQLDAGETVLNWNAGQRTSGVYYVRVTALNQLRVVRIVLTR